MVWQRSAAWIPETSHMMAVDGCDLHLTHDLLTVNKSDPVIILSAQQRGMHTFVEVACEFHILVSSLAGRDGRAGFTPDGLKRRFQGFTKRTENTPNV